MTPKQMLASEIIEEVKRMLADLPESPEIERLEAVNREYLGMRSVTIVLNKTTLHLSIMGAPDGGLKP